MPPTRLVAMKRLPPGSRILAAYREEMLDLLVQNDDLGVPHLGTLKFLSEQALKLRQKFSTRVADVASEVADDNRYVVGIHRADDGGVYEGVGDDGLNPVYENGPRRPTDLNEMLRELMMILEKQVSGITKMRDIPEPTCEQELQALLYLRNNLELAKKDISTVDAKIEKLLARMAVDETLKEAAKATNGATAPRSTP